MNLWGATRIYYGITAYYACMTAGWAWQRFHSSALVPDGWSWLINAAFYLWLSSAVLAAFRPQYRLFRLAHFIGCALITWLFFRFNGGYSVMPFLILSFALIPAIAKEDKIISWSRYMVFATMIWGSLVVSTDGQISLLLLLWPILPPVLLVLGKILGLALTTTAVWLYFRRDNLTLAAILMLITIIVDHMVSREFITLVAIPMVAYFIPRKSRNLEYTPQWSAD